MVRLLLSEQLQNTDSSASELPAGIVLYVRKMTLGIHTSLTDTGHLTARLLRFRLPSPLVLTCFWKTRSSAF